MPKGDEKQRNNKDLRRIFAGPSEQNQRAGLGHAEKSVAKNKNI